MLRGRSSGYSFVVLGIVIVCVVTFCGQDVCADGKHFPEKAYKQPPAIPSQRAILTYKDGIEKLTIELAEESTVWCGDLVLTQTDDDGTVAMGVTSLSYSWIWGGKNVSGVLEYFYSGFGQGANDYSPESLADNQELLGTYTIGVEEPNYSDVERVSVGVQDAAPWAKR